MSGYLGDAANAKNHRYGRTWVAMFSVTVPGQIFKRQGAKEHVAPAPALAVATCPLVLRQASRSSMLCTWGSQEKPALVAGRNKGTCSGQLKVLSSLEAGPCPALGLLFAGILFTMGLVTTWEVPGCLQPVEPWSDSVLSQSLGLVHLPMFLNMASSRSWISSQEGSALDARFRVLAPAPGSQLFLAFEFVIGFLVGCCDSLELRKFVPLSSALAHSRSDRKREAGKVFASGNTIGPLLVGFIAQVQPSS